MKITVKKSEELAIVPHLFIKEENPPKFIFRTPNATDILKFIWTNDIEAILCDCFEKFENQIELVDENGKELNYTTYKEFISAGLSGEILLIHNECLNAMAEKLTEMVKQAENTEKKSKSPLSCGKTKKQRTLKG